MSESPAEATPGPVREARAAVAAWETRRGDPRPDRAIKITDSITKRRLIFDAPIAFHVVVWMTVGGFMVTGTLKANDWMGGRTRHESEVDTTIASIIKRQDATDAAIRELATPVRDLANQVSRLGGIIDSRNRLNGSSGGGE